MPSLEKWVRKKLPWSKKDTPSPHIPGPLPFLPSERPSILTPSPSREALVSSMESYGSFQFLPYEIRRAILIEALGGRTLHIDLRYDKRVIRGKDGKLIINKDGTVRRTTHPSWHWFGCVCHQPKPWPQKKPRRLCVGICTQHIENHRNCGPWIDDKVAPFDCHINVMGWLLACRQAYAEGIDIQFSTNTIHMECYDLLRNLPRIILPQRLHSIEVLELAWTFRSSVGIRTQDPLNVLCSDPETKDSELHEMCRMVPKLFPRLRQLDILLICRIRVPYPPLWENLGSSEHVILDPIKDMIRVLGPGPEICIAIKDRRGILSAGASSRRQTIIPLVSYMFLDSGLLALHMSPCLLYSS
ncbi:hypothetical protein O988_07510 [Pseudogymnoascus sp. VKM F-3808]|nr:hypothetical protein O988_07510 [Pseudogymnoascus sp. VKM F-3808]